MIAAAADIREATAERRFIVETMKDLKGKTYLYFYGPERPTDQESWFEDFDMPTCGSDRTGCTVRYPEGTDLDLESATRWRHLAESKFNLQFTQDSSRSQKLENAAQVGTFNIFLDDNALDSLLPFPCILPWTRMSYYMNKSVFLKDPAAVLADAVNRDNSTFAARLEAYQSHLPDILWTHPKSRVAENVLLTAARRCVPESHLNEMRLTKFDFQCVSSVFSQSG